MYRDINKIVPHRHPMIMIDGYQKIDDNSAIAEKTFHDHDYCISSGYVVDSILIECIAQAVAAHLGYDCLTKNKTNAEAGMLVAVDTFMLLQKVKTETRISINIEKQNQLGAFKIYYGKIYSQNKLIAEGQIKLFVTE